MPRIIPVFGLVAAVLLAQPAAADKVVVMKAHTDEMSMMGQKTPAQDIEQLYWFGDDALRFDAGDSSTVIRAEAKKLIFMDHTKKTYSEIDLPLDFKDLVGPEMAPMIDQMMKMMAASVEVTPTERTGKFGGFACDYSKVKVSMGMMQMAMDVCTTGDLGIDYSRFDSLRKAQAEMVPNSKWIKDLAESLKGFPVYSTTTTTVMGKEFKSTQELVGVEDRSAAAGFYGAPEGYELIKFDPMANSQRGRRK